MHKIDCLYLSVKNIYKNRVRSTICILAVAIGILSIVLIDTAGSFGQDFISEKLSSIGIEGISVYIEDGVEKLSDKDGVIIKENFKNVSEAMPLITQVGKFSTEIDSGNAVVWGTSSNVDKAFNLKISNGRKFTENDIKFKKKVVMVDETLAKKLYKRKNIVGKKIKLSVDQKIDTYTIVGIIQSQFGNLSSVMGSSTPYFVYVPYTCIQNNDEVDQIVVSCFNEEDYKETSKKVKDYLTRNKQNDVCVQNISGYIGTVNTVIKSIKIVLSIIGSIAFVVAIIGVINSMLASVSERKKEIGIYMALGAKNHNILNLIIVEAIILCGIGGIIGSFCGAIIILIISHVLPLNITIKLSIIGISIIISLIFGIVSALFPAKIATSLNPIDALRN